jgi:dihydrodipicolinate synthase/N-acetylneuraminate lyase
MEAPNTPRGLIVDLITPLKHDGSIDGRGLAKLLDRVLSHAQGVLLAGPHAGGGIQLTALQREEILEKAVVVVRERVPILVWVTRKTEQETEETILALNKRLEHRNYSGPVFWVDTPLFYHSNRGLPSLYRKMCAMGERPFVLYNDPALIRQLARPLKRNNIRTAILKEIISLEGVAGLIFVGALERSHHYQRASRLRPQFRIYDGDESQFLDHPSLSGVVSYGANLAPKAWQMITRSSLRLAGDERNYPGHLQHVWETGRYLRDLKEIYQKMPSVLIRAVLSDMGILDESSPGGLEETDLDGLKNRLKALMTVNGDYPERRIPV